MTDGHSCVGFISHEGPRYQPCCLDIKALASISLVRRSAGLDVVEQYLYVLCEVMSLISCTRCRINCCRGGFDEDIHDNTICESFHKIISDVENFRSMVFDRYLDNSAPSTAANSSNRGIVCGFMGATLLLDIANVHFVQLLGVFPLR